MESTELTVRLIIPFIPGIIETFIYQTLQGNSICNKITKLLSIMKSEFDR
jgi:hypothetical protein